MRSGGSKGACKLRGCTKLDGGAVLDKELDKEVFVESIRKRPKQLEEDAWTAHAKAGWAAVIDKRCLICDFYDPDFECTCPSHEMWYARPLSPEPTREDFERRGMKIEDGYLPDE